jgi:aspartate aminotransferase
MAVNQETPPPSCRLIDYPPNPIRMLAPLAAAARSKGIEVISLNIGAPDTPTPPEILAASQHFLAENETICYGPSAGNPEIIKEMAVFNREMLGISGLGPENILITQGVSEAIQLAFFAVADPGETIFTPDPYYSNYAAFAHEYGINLAPIPTRMADGFHLIGKDETRQEAKKRISSLISQSPSRPRALLLNSPTNPTGAVFSLSELELAAEIAADFNLFLISDEVYRTILFEGAVKPGKIPRAPSIYDVLTTPKERKRAIGFDSTSKMLSFCGARVGMLFVHQDLAPLFVNKASSRGCPSTIGQAALHEINNIPPDYFINNKEEFRARRDVLIDELRALSDLGVVVPAIKPEGAFYIIADLNLPGEDFCTWLLTDFPAKSGSKETIFLAPIIVAGGGFSSYAEQHRNQVRIAYTVNTDNLRRASNILRQAISLYRQEKGL